jgi:hypothetical protein
MADDLLAAADKVPLLSWKNKIFNMYSPIAILLFILFGRSLGECGCWLFKLEPNVPWNFFNLIF